MSARRRRSTKPGGYYELGPGGLTPQAFARWYRDSLRQAWEGLDLEAVGALVQAVAEARRRGRRVWVVGNGGSAATASHWSTDLSKTAAAPGRPGARAISLTDNVAFITAVGNDLSFDDIFSRQLEDQLEKGDVLVLISGSGNSRNLLSAAKLANRRGALTVGVLGFDGGALKRLVRLAVVVPSEQYGVIEDVHLGLGHVITFYLKQALKQARAAR